MNWRAELTILNTPGIFDEYGPTASEEKPASSHGQQAEDNQMDISFSQVGQPLPFHHRNCCITVRYVKL
jgi:hypothetical protein